MLDIAKIRRDFPVLSQEIGGHPLIYLDNAATTQLPACVLDAWVAHYREENANVHRGIHTLSERSTAAFENARDTVRDYLGAASSEEIVFTSGTTDAVNLAAQGMRHLLGPGDSVVVTELEHHSNFLPWQRLCRETGADFRVVPCPGGDLDFTAYREALTRRPKLVAAAQVTNTTGTVFPVREMADLAHDAGAWFFTDGAQGARHGRMSDLGCDFYAFSGHKILAPGGIGVLYGKRELLEKLEPVRVGGGMVDEVYNDRFTDGPLPTRFEAGTPNVAGAIGLGEALRYLTRLGRAEITAYEEALTAYAADALGSLRFVHVLGRPAHRCGSVAFVLDGVHPYDAASVLDKFGVAMRSGTHCAQPALRSFGCTSALRLSVAFYNTRAEIDAACEALTRTMELFAKWKRK